jgi:hypothetical protein
MNVRYALAALILGSAALAGRAEAADAVTIQNGLLRIDWQADQNTFSLTHLTTGRRFAAAGPLAGTRQASVVDVADDHFGQSGAIEIRQNDGSALRLMLFEGVPFALVQSILSNGGQEEKIVATVSQPDLRLELGKPPSQLKALGTAGLTAPDGHSGSYVFLAVADPDTRDGVVGAWLTHDRGSGVVFSSIADGAVHLRPQIDYGRLPIGPGETAESETFAIGWFADARLGLEAWADLVARRYDVRLRPQPDGYCTWYSSPNGGASDEEHLAELAGFAAKELAPFGFRFVQIDDKWQEGTRRNGPAKVFCRHKPAGPYPGGMKQTADGVRALGLTAGLWFMPFAGDHLDPFFAYKQHWFVKRADGTPYEARWGGTSLDMTCDDARQNLAGLVRRFSQDWGYKYFKMDGLWTGTATELLYVNNDYKPDDIGQAVFHDPDVTPIEAYRSGLRLVRQAAGDDVFLLGCCVSQNMRSFGGAFGLVDAMRIGPDNGTSIQGLKRGPWHGSNRYFLHGRVWYNDPDPVYVRTSLPLKYARQICSWVAVTGQLNVSSDWLPGLPPERLDLIKRTLPNHGLLPRPVDLFESELPRIWLLSDEKSGVRRDVVGLFNWDDEQPARIDCPADKLGLPPAAGYVGFDYWADRFVPPFSGNLQADVPAGSCSILALRGVADHPQAVSTSRHITQGVVDLAAEAWDEAAGVLSGTSRVVAGDPYEIRIVVPAGRASWKAEKAELVSPPAGTTATFVQDGPKIRLRIESPEGGEIRWRLHFVRSSVEVAPPEPVTDLRAEASYTRVALTWSGSPAESYRIVRQGGSATATVEVRETAYEDTQVEHGVAYRYRVEAVNWRGETSPAAVAEVVMPNELRRPAVPPVPDVQVSDLDPLAAETGWGKVAKDRSCEENPLTLDGKRYEKGMGVHARSQLVYAIPAGAKRFVAMAGLDDEKKTDLRSSVVFKVLGDVEEMGEAPVLLADSPRLSNETLRTWCFDIELSSRFKAVHLIVEDAGDGFAADHADWVNAGFIK